MRGKGKRGGRKGKRIMTHLTSYEGLTWSIDSIQLQQKAFL